ncbi:MAG: glutamine--fructose-6-phosphate transaminase (isomerizing) [Fimbriimonadia bacterium]|nr:glutamine--fructose-6-phosphate transaminase (isomerizing) [Fimbriimonadia bacterium]
MCGITGYIGPKAAIEIALETLKRLEYRGYDSAGVAFWDGQSLNVLKRAGKISNLIEMAGDIRADGLAVSHTRWATHGVPNDPNAHPQTDEEGQVAVVHNGIIENYLELRHELSARGHRFNSDTDTEVLAHLIEEQLETSDNPEEAVRLALQQVRGSYGIAVLFARFPDRIVIARNDSPLVIGLGEGETYLASDITAMLSYTRKVILLENGDLATIKRDEVRLYRLDGSSIERPPMHVDWSAEAAEKGGHEHFMIKEILEQPEAVRDTLRGRLKANGGIEFPDIKLEVEDWQRYRRILIVACGTAYHAGLIGKHIFEKWLRRPVEVYHSSEFRYGDPILHPQTLAIFISQSGETADTLAALRLCREAGYSTLGIVNAVGSSIARECDHVLYTQAGPEISVASTKAYSTQITALYMLGLFLSNVNGTLSMQQYTDATRGLMQAPSLISRSLEMEAQARQAAEALKEMPLAFYLGRGIDAYVAMEGALKIKEIAYVPTQECAAGEMKHGPLALVEPGVVAVFVATQARTREKILGNLKEIKARRGTVLLITSEGETDLPQEADYTLFAPKVEPEALSPLATIPLLQLFAYHVARLRGCEIDQPRNLAKSVTVE